MEKEKKKKENKNEILFNEFSLFNVILLYHTFNCPCT